MMRTPSPSTLQIKRKVVHRIRKRRSLNGDISIRASLSEVPSNQHDFYYKMSEGSAVIQRQEMDTFFQLLEDERIRKFLKMDSCYKIADKYLLAMTFVYFKRAHFSTSEYTRENFFIALYLAHTMEEDDDKCKYDILPWALGGNWMKRFPGFLKQRDKLWARIDHRAVVSRRCCEEVMAIESSHLAWQRQRHAHHSGVQRVYCDQDKVICPRGPSARPLPCVSCNMSRPQPLSPFLFSPRGSTLTFIRSPLKFNFPLGLDVSPPRGATCQAGYTLSQAGGSFCICPKEIPWANPACEEESACDWFEE